MLRVLRVLSGFSQKNLRNHYSLLTTEFGRGFSRQNLQNMRAFYLTYQKCQTLSGKLSWSRYCELLSISDDDKRSFHEKESLNSGWSVRELKRQISPSLYERLILSDGKANKETVLSLAQQGIELSNPADIIKDPWAVLNVLPVICTLFQEPFELYEAPSPDRPIMRSISSSSRHCVFRTKEPKCTL